MMNISNTLTPQQAAEYLRLSPSTLAKWRSNGDGPLFSKLGSSVRYSRSDLDAFVESRRFSNTASRAPTDE